MSSEIRDFVASDPLHLTQGWENWVKKRPVKYAVSAIGILAVGVVAVSAVQTLRELSARKAKRQINIVFRPGMTPAQEMEEFFAEVQREQAARIVEHRRAYLQFCESYRTEREKELDASLQTALGSGDLMTCRRLIKEGASVKAKNAEGLTPLKTVLEGGHLKRVKFLIDNRAIPDADDVQKIRSLLAQCNIHEEYKIQIFLTRRPNLYEPEIFINGTFRPLEDLARMNPQDVETLTQGKGIALLNIADESLKGLYAGVSKKFTAEWQKTYAKIADHFILVRGLVDRPEQLIPIIDQVEHFLPGRPIVDWALDGHSNVGHTVLGESDCRLSINDTGLMQAIAARLDPFAVISLWGCLTAMDHANLARTFSKNSDGRIVCGSQRLVNNVIPQIFFNAVLQRPMLIPCFEICYQKQVKLYSNDKLIIDSIPTGASCPAELVAACNAEMAKIAMQINGLPTRIYEDYFLHSRE